MSASDAVTAATAVTGTARRERIAAFVQQQGATVVLVALVVVSSLAFDSFASADNLRNIAVQGSFLAIIALGMTFVILTGGIDLSVGSVFALGGVLAAYGSPHGVVAGIVLPVAGGAVFGLVQGVLVARGRLAPFIVTLAGLLGARGLVLALTDEGNTTPRVESDALVALGRQGPGSLTWSVVIVVVLFVVGWVVLHRTGTGATVLAIGGSSDAARLMGLPVVRTTTAVYVASGTLAAFAGALNAARSGSGVTTVGFGFELEAISAVVIGGTLLTGGLGNVTGTLAGVYLLGVIQNVINQIGSLTSSIQSVVSGSFLLIVVVVQTVLSRARQL